MTPLAHAFTGLIRIYQYAIAPLLNGRCRYLPTCSHYALEAIERHGALKGAALAGLRLLRCHPWGGAGYDPVPEPAGAHARPSSSTP
ncbi:MAG: membrane protein insertion efficiency factor YidD [Alphaproteobacteria bacterium]